MNRFSPSFEVSSFEYDLIVLAGFLEGRGIAAEIHEVRVETIRDVEVGIIAYVAYDDAGNPHERIIEIFDRVSEAKQADEEAQRADQEARLTAAGPDMESHPVPSEDNRDDDKHVAQNGSD